MGFRGILQQQKYSKISYSRSALFISCTAQPNLVVRPSNWLPLTLLYGPAISIVRPTKNRPLLVVVRPSNFGPPWLLYDLVKSASLLLKCTAWYDPVYSRRYSLSAAKNLVSTSYPRCPKIAPQ
jgi:hypothetical protein